MLHFLITLGLTAAIYTLPLIILLPFKLKAAQKIILTLITVMILTVASLTIGNIGVIFLLAADSIYIALIDCHRLRNILLFLFSYFLNVVIGNILSVPICLIANITIEHLQETPIFYHLFFTTYFFALILLLSASYANFLYFFTISFAHVWRFRRCQKKLSFLFH